MANDKQAREGAQLAGEKLLSEHLMEDPFAAAIKATRMPMLITDPRQPDNPIIFCNTAFLTFTGYTMEEVIGANCRFLQGPKTDLTVIQDIRAAIAADQPISANILNYRKDGREFWNALFISPVHNAQGETIYFFASQLDFTNMKEKEKALESAQEMAEREIEKRTSELRAALEAKTVLLHEVDHRVKNNLLMIASLLKLEARQTDNAIARQTLSSVLDRIEALSAVQRKLLTDDNVAGFDVSDFCRELTQELASANPLSPSVTLDLQPVWVPAAKASPLALMINELLRMALRPHSEGRQARAECHISKTDKAFLISIRDGHAFAELEHKSFGRIVIDTCARQLSAKLHWHAWEHGTAVDVRLPIEIHIEE